MTDKYILGFDGHTPIPCEDLMVWAEWFAEAERHVADTMIGQIRVSTVFLGLDHSFGGQPPILFESLIFGGPKDGLMQRYSTWEEAERGHAEMVAAVEDSGGDK